MNIHNNNFTSHDKKTYYMKLIFLDFARIFMQNEYNSSWYLYIYFPDF